MSPLVRAQRCPAERLSRRRSASARTSPGERTKRSERAAHRVARCSHRVAGSARSPMRSAAEICHSPLWNVYARVTQKARIGSVRRKFNVCEKHPCESFQLVAQWRRGPGLGLSQCFAARNMKALPQRGRYCYSHSHRAAQRRRRSICIRAAQSCSPIDDEQNGLG